MVVTLVVLVNVLGGDSEDDAAPRGPAEVEGTAPPQRADLPPLPVDVPPVTPEAGERCPALMSRLPPDLDRKPSRPVQADSRFAYAWGDPAIVLRCGVDRPAGWVIGAPAIQIDGVQWYVDTADPETTVWTTVDRPVYVEVRLPRGVDSAPVTALTAPVAEALPYVQPTPGR